MAAACSNSKEESENLVATTDTTSFYPLASYIKDQVKYFDSTRVRFSVVTTEGTIKDSISTQLAAIMQIMQPVMTTFVSGISIPV